MDSSMFVRIFDVLGVLLQPLQPLLLECAFLAAAYCAILQLCWFLGRPARKNALKHYLISGAIALSIAGSEAIFEYAMKSSAIEEARAFLNEPILSVYVDGKVIDNPGLLVESLKNIFKADSSKSNTYSPDDCNQPYHYRIFILRIKTEKKDRMLSLLRNKQDAQQYFVCYQRENSIRKNYIWQIHTEILNKY